MARSAILYKLMLPVVLLVFVGGCAEQTDNTGQHGFVVLESGVDFQKWLAHAADQNAQVAVGDILLIYEKEESELNRVLWVDDTGVIWLRELGPVRVANLTPAQVKAELENLYAEKEVEAVLQVRNLRQCILITGEIEKPGLYGLTGGKELEKVISDADGFTDEADPAGVSVFRKTAGAIERKRLNYKKDENKKFEVLPGDRVTVLRRIDYSLN